MFQLLCSGKPNLTRLTFRASQPDDEEEGAGAGTMGHRARRAVIVVQF